MTGKLTTDQIAKLGVIVEYASSDAWRVIIGGEIVGFALRMSAGGLGRIRHGRATRFSASL